MFLRKIQNVTIECVQGDIAMQPGFDAVVNAANAALRPGGGVAGAIHRAAGPGLDEECRPLAPIRPGEAVITGAHRLPNRHVIHVLGPVYGRDEPSEDLLASCYRNTLRLAEHHGLRSIAFPAVSTGAFGYPFEPAVRTALESVVREAERLSYVEIIRFVLFDTADLEAFGRIFAELIPENGGGVE